MQVPLHELAEDGTALVMERFDLRPDGTYRGFEDFCVLQCAPYRSEKYRGSYETNIMKRFQQFAASPGRVAGGSSPLRSHRLELRHSQWRRPLARKNFGIVFL